MPYVEPHATRFRIAMRQTSARAAAPAARSFRPDRSRQRDLRDAFGRFGTGVTVVTAQIENRPVGMTANSFTSVSLDPALILWSPALNSQRYVLFERAEHFCVHVLSEDQCALARHFAARGDGFERFEWSDGPDGAPALHHCLAEFHCSTYAIHPAGDHALILGEVRHVRHSACDTPGLLFERSMFGRFSTFPDDQ
jgi:flavin reductase (DIM6/NTAB) family NADH-FMN oxidoreductase RutF